MDLKNIRLALMEAYENKKPVNVTLKIGGKYSGVVQAVSADDKWTLQLLNIEKAVVLKESEMEEVIWLGFLGKNIRSKK